MSVRTTQVITAISRARLLTVGVATIVASWTSTADAVTPTAAGSPKLLVTILVEGLDENCLRMLRPVMGAGGFNRLFDEGLSAGALDYGRSADATSATAMLFTGCGAAVNGIPSDEIYDVATGLTVPSLLDKDALGNFTSRTLSPANISVSTLADEIRVSGAGSAKVRSVALHPEQAIIMSGHAGNSALWIEPTMPQWATSTYYRETPGVLTKINYGSPLTARLDTMRWVPSSAALTIGAVPESKKKYAFSYTFPAKSPASADAFLHSPKANEEVASVALNQLEGLGNPSLGTDMLGVAFTLSPYPYSRTADSRLELYDAYLRLDAEIARIITAAERAAGKSGSVVVLAGLPPATRPGRDDEQWRIPGGKFSPKKAVSLLNMYLMAVHGSGEWVKGYHNKQFYLNEGLAEQRKVSLPQLRAEAASFLAKMSGVRRAQTLDAVISEDATESVTASVSGDIFIDITPGWEIESDVTSASTTKRCGVERAMPPMPLYIMAPGLKAGRIAGMVDARRVAPTVAGILRIRSPGGADKAPLAL